MYLPDWWSWRVPKRQREYSCTPSFKKRAYFNDASSWVELAHKLRAEGEESELLSIVDLQS